MSGTTGHSARTPWQIGGLLAVVVLGGCETVNEILPLAVPPGGRELIVTVTNTSPRPATLLVGADVTGVPPAVGTANPPSVAAGATVEVHFGVPAGSDWAIFVNPGPERGPLVLAQDIPPNVAGPMPFTIGIGEHGDPYSRMTSLPGWFGD